jgi:hypothetical protein
LRTNIGTQSTSSFGILKEKSLKKKKILKIFYSIYTMFLNLPKERRMRLRENLVKENMFILKNIFLKFKVSA